MIILQEGQRGTNGRLLFMVKRQQSIMWERNGYKNERREFKDRKDQEEQQDSSRRGECHKDFSYRWSRRMYSGRHRVLVRGEHF